MSGSGFDDATARAAIIQAIADYNANLVVYYPIADRSFNLGGSEVINITNTFSQYDTTPLTIEIYSNSNPNIVSASLNGNNLSIAASSFNPGVSTIQIKATDKYNASVIEEFSVIVSNPVDVNVENFNDGNFTAPAYTWTLTKSSGARDWVTTTTTPQEGTYCAGTDAGLKDAQWCAISTTINFASAGKVSFYKKTSSETGYDFLKFYVDGVMQGQWSGTVAWSKSEYIIGTTGNHTLKFEYIKDSADDGGTDQVWVDYLEVISNATPVTPAAPVLASPANLSTTADTTPTFDWNDVTGATLYDILVDNNSNFSSPEVNTSVSASTYTVATKALVNGTYYWKTKVNSTSGPYSETWSVTIGSTVTPAIPSNLTTSLVSGNVYINWDNAADATSYDVYSSATPYGTYSLLTNITSSEYTYTPTAAKMFFYVVSKNTTKESPSTIEVK